MIKFACSKCGRQIKVDDKHAGKKGKCPGCGQAVTVPGKSNTIVFACAGCGHKIKVPQSYAGKKGKCPKCKQPVEVPGKKATPAPTAKPESIPQPSPISTVPCVMCAHEIVVPDESPDAPVQCPECGCSIDPVSGGFAAGPEDAEPQVDEEDYEGPDTPPATRGSAGPDRRLIMILAGAAVIVIVAVIGLVIFLKSSGSDSTTRPERQRSSRPVAGAEARADEQPPSPEPARVASFRFAPAPGTKRTMRVQAVSKQSTQGPDTDREFTDDTTFTYDLEVGQAQADGAVPLTVVLTAVQYKRVDGQGQTSVDYDSTRPQDHGNSRGRFFEPFLNKSFMARVSSRGDAVDIDADEMFRIAAEEGIRAAIERRKQEGRDPDKRSFEERVQSRVDAFRRIRMFAGNTFSDLVKEIVSMVPGTRLREGATWDEPVPITQVPGMTMATTYSVTALDDDRCTIQAEGQRSRDEGPIIVEEESYRSVHELDGTYRATFQLDRRAGWLLSKEQRISFSGQHQFTFAGRDPEPVEQIAREITTTITTVSSSTSEVGSAGNESASSVHLQFAPPPGTKRTMRVRTVSTHSIEQGDQTEAFTATETFGFELEARPAEADGTIPLTLSLATVQTESAAQAMALEQYDSTQPQDGSNPDAPFYAPLIQKPFAMRVSSRGEIVSIDLDTLFGPNIQGGGPMNRNKLSGLLAELVLALPVDPVHKDTMWSQPLCVSQVDPRCKMAGTHTVTALGADTCTIQAEGKRDIDEEAIVQQMDQMKVTCRLGGFSGATYTVDVETGWLLSKEQKSHLSGQMETSLSGVAGAPDLESTQQVTFEFTTTVTTID